MLLSQPGDNPATLQLRNLQLQRQRCNGLERFSRQKKKKCFQSALGYSWRCRYFYSAGAVTSDRM
jgi:hypothetical protein